MWWVSLLLRRRAVWLSTGTRWSSARAAVAHGSERARWAGGICTCWGDHSRRRSSTHDYRIRSVSSRRSSTRSGLRAKSTWPTRMGSRSRSSRAGERVRGSGTGPCLGRRLGGTKGLQMASYFWRNKTGIDVWHSGLSYGALTRWGTRIIIVITSRNCGIGHIYGLF